MTTATARTRIRKSKVWTETEYLDLDDGLLVEFDHGQVEVLPMPGPFHQKIVARLLVKMTLFVEARQLGNVLTAPLPVKVAPSKFREPDLIFRATVSESNIRQQKYWDNVQLVVEVMSEGSKNRARDQIQKRKEYAAAGISEYWIIDPKTDQVTVLTLSDGTYSDSVLLGINDVVRSKVLTGFEIPVATVFAD